ncbi:WG repeat-containing protein [Ursidibacter arcticus]
MQRKLIPCLLPLMLSACFDDNAKQCVALFNDENKQPLAMDYCKRAAESGDVQSQMILGKLLLAENNLEQAVTWLEKSASQNADARLLLGEIYETPKYNRQDMVSAKFYYHKGCELGNIKACERHSALEAIEKEKEASLEQEKQRADEHKKLEAERKLIETQKAALETERKQREKQLEEEKRLLEERKAFEQQKIAEEKRLAEERQMLERQKQSQASYSTTNSYSSNTSYERKDTTDLKFFDGLAAFKENGLYGFVNREGYVVIKPQFAYAGRFSRGRSAVQSTTNNLWGFIDINGNYVVYPEHCSLGAFSEKDGLAGVYKNGYKVGDTCVGGKWGFIDPSGNWVINPVLDHAERFINGKAKVTYKGTTGFINRNGQWVE